MAALLFVGAVLPYWVVPDNLISRLGGSPWVRVAGLAGYAVALSGFGLTIWGVLRSKSAAESAESAAESARQQLSRSQAIADVSRVLTAMEEIKRHHRAKNWRILPDRYSSLRKLLITLRSLNPKIDEHYGESVQSAVRQLGIMEDEVEKVIHRDESVDPVYLNSIVSTQVDKLSEMLGQFLREVEVDNAD